MELLYSFHGNDIIRLPIEERAGYMGRKGYPIKNGIAGNDIPTMPILSGNKIP